MISAEALNKDGVGCVGIVASRTCHNETQPSSQGACIVPLRTPRQYNTVWHSGTLHT